MATVAPVPQAGHDVVVDLPTKGVNIRKDLFGGKTHEQIQKLTPNGEFALVSEDIKTLREYTKAGYKLPNSNDEFERRHPKKLVEEYLTAFKGAGDLSNLYILLRNDTVTISQCCRTFEEDTLGRIGDVGGDVSSFAMSALKSTMRLADALNKLYENEAALERDREKARGDARATIKNLIKLCTTNSNNCAMVQAKMVSFRIETEKHKNDLGLDLQKLKRATPKLTKETNKKSIEVDHDRLQLIDANQEVVKESLKQNLFTRPILQIEASFLWARDKVQNKEDLAERKEKKLNQSRELSKASKDSHDRIFEIQVEMKQYMDMLAPVEQKMESAIAAMKKIHSAFSLMKSDLQYLETSLDEAKDELGDDFPEIVKNLKAMEPSLEKLRDAAKEFQKNPYADAQVAPTA